MNDGVEAVIYGLAKDFLDYCEGEGEHVDYGVWYDEMCCGDIGHAYSSYDNGYNVSWCDRFYELPAGNNKCFAENRTTALVRRQAETEAAKNATLGHHLSPNQDAVMERWHRALTQNVVAEQVYCLPVPMFSL